MTDTDSSYFLQPFMKRRARTRIVCTIGPATGTLSRIKRLIRSGMSVGRLNLSHGTPDEHHAYVRMLRDAAEEMGIAVGILADLPGPKYRVGEMEQDEILLVTGQHFVLQVAPCGGNSERANVWPPGLHNDIKRGSQVLIDEGTVEMRVESIQGTDINCRVTLGGVMKPNKAVTVPGNTSTLDYFTSETEKALKFVESSDVDFVGLSYVRNADDMQRVRAHLLKAGKTPQLVAKIEIQQAVDNLVEILDESDAIMVARGDLGVELPFEKVPAVQKQIIRMANEAGKPVITATQMLESMIEQPSPTRAEATDVYNAVRDGTDAIMLSGETSIGKFPFRAVNAMARIAKRAESYLEYPMLAERHMAAAMKGGLGVDDAIAAGAVVAASRLNAKAIVAFTESGSTAGRVASYRPPMPLFALTPDFTGGAKLALRWGVIPVVVQHFEQLQDMFYAGSQLVLETSIAKEGDVIVVVVGLPIGFAGTTNLLRVITLPEPFGN
ncbi:MAG: pyruvate kinase [Chloroflexi bacterium]|nr:pyruvate kinase [Chloroflexota bacterium]